MFDVESGFAIVLQPTRVEQSEGRNTANGKNLFSLQAAKPDYEVGSSAQLKLSFAPKAPGMAALVGLGYRRKNVSILSRYFLAVSIFSNDILANFNYLSS